MDSKGDISEFNAFVAQCAGSDRKEQYLVRILKELVSKKTGQDLQLSDDNVLKALGVSNIESVFAAMTKLGNIYSVVAKLLLEDSSVEWNVVRWEVKKHIQMRYNKAIKVNV